MYYCCGNPISFSTQSFTLTPYICFHFSSHPFEAVKSVNSSFSSHFEEGAFQDTSLYLCIFHTICTNGMENTIGDTFCNFHWKTRNSFAVFSIFQNIWNGCFSYWKVFTNFRQLVLGCSFAQSKMAIFSFKSKHFLFGAPDKWWFEDGMTVDVCLRNNKFRYIEIRNSQVTKSSYETELRKMTSHFELLTRKLL